MSRPPELPDFPASQLFLRRLAYSLVHDEARADDLVQETWAAWVEHRPRKVVEPRAWLARVLRNRAFNAKRSDARRAEREALAGQPDPSAPETDGTLEAQAQLIEALRALEEPYRSTLVQRYYHDLAPKEIAERSGAPLNTVKARLARGLEKLRAALDRRYHGDRKAWCHWLTVLGSPPPVVVPGSNAPLTGVGGSPSMLASLGTVLVLAALAAWKLVGGGARTDDTTASREGSQVIDSRAPEVQRSELGRAPAPREKREELAADVQPRASTELTTPRAVPSEPLVPAEVGYGGSPDGERETFDWPQYAGGPARDNWRAREDEIVRPRVAWFAPGCAGQPTLSGGDLYTGGIALVRLDPVTGRATGVALGLLAETLEVELSALERLIVIRDGGVELHLEVLNEPEFGTVMKELEGGLRQLEDDVAAASAITATLVIARRARDGGVSAFDRELETEVWRWNPTVKPGRRAKKERVLPGCLVNDELFVFGTDDALIALRVEDGSVAWRFEPRTGPIDTVPASAEGCVFTTVGGRLQALDAVTGRELWHASLGYDCTTLAVLGDRVLVADRGLQKDGDGELERKAPIQPPGRLHALNPRTGDELWATPFQGHRLSALGMGHHDLYAVAGYGDEVVRFDLDRGRIDERHRVKTGRNPFGSPTVVGTSLVFGNLDGHLYVHDVESGELRWSFRAPESAAVHDFVHSGKRIYVSTATGLVCIVDDPTQPPLEPGSVLVLELDELPLAFLQNLFEGK